MARKTKSSAKRRALLVVDMLRGFLEPEGSLYCGEGSRDIIPYVARRIRTFARRGDLVVFVCDRHAEDDPEFRLYPAHCVAGSWEAEIVPDLPVPEGSRLIPKTTLDPFYQTHLDRVLRRHGPEEVEVLGVCTNICVLIAVIGLAVREMPTVVRRKGVATFDAEAHEQALGQMESVFGATVK
ncbi:MAG: isochorismatase family cysteine hydrolase [Phycisphaerae bacterium]